MTSSAADSSQAMWDLGSVQNRLAVCQKRRSRYLRRSSSTSSPSSSSPSSSSFLSTASVLTASAASASACSASLGFDVAWLGGLCFGLLAVGCLLRGLGLRFLALAVVFVRIAARSVCLAGTLTCTGGFRRAFGHICPGRLMPKQPIAMGRRAFPQSRLTTASRGFSCADTDRVSGCFRRREGVLGELSSASTCAC